MSTCPFKTKTQTTPLTTLNPNTTQTTTPVKNIEENKYISTLNEFEKSCIPILDFNDTGLNDTIKNFVNATREFGANSCAGNLKNVIANFERLERHYANLINHTHRKYDSVGRRDVETTTPAVFLSLSKGIKILRIFHDFCGKHHILDKEIVREFMDLTKDDRCSTMAVYVEIQFFESMNDICRNFNKADEKVCSTSVAYRSSKERLDNINKRDISQSYVDIKNFLDTWIIFLDKVVTFIMKNYLRLRDKKASLCFRTFLNQQYQIVLDYYSQYHAYEMKLNIQKEKENKGLIWN